VAMGLYTLVQVQVKVSFFVKSEYLGAAFRYKIFFIDFILILLFKYNLLSIYKGDQCMTIISLRDISVSFGGPAVLSRISMQIEPGERVCLVGRNGEGKSTLMKVIAGEIMPDSGKIVRQQGLSCARLSQELPENVNGNVFDVVAAGLGELFGLLAKHHQLAKLLEHDHSPALCSELERVEHELETAGGWQAMQRVQAVLTRLDLDGETLFTNLSGGLRRRVLLAQVLVNEPGLLLLDEPTNHLDIKSITWLEDFLLASGLTLLFVTHDRMLIRNIATRILDLDRGILTSWPGNYDTYLQRKDEMLNNEATQQAKFDRKMAQEEIWIRQGVKARRTRNEGRVRSLVKMREEYKSRQAPVGSATMKIQEAETSGKLVVKAKNITFLYDGQTIIDNFSTTILRGDKVGIIGPNGVGKTTLLRLLLGSLTPSVGSVQNGTNLQIAYSDQLRTQLNEEETVIANVGEGSDTLIINGRQKHIIGYLEDFLFTPDRARSPVYVLSGGERNRLLLAKLFSKPANVLVLDEPTNDLDAETLDLLEELLFDFAGTVLLVSHDRAFLNNVVTSTLVFEGSGRIQQYAGGYDDWLVQRPQELSEISTQKGKKRELKKTGAVRPRKLTFREKQELDSLPPAIEAMEVEQDNLYKAMAEPGFFQQDKEVVEHTQMRLPELEQLLAVSYARWEELEKIREQGE